MSLLDVHRAFLADAVARLGDDPRVAAVVLTGSGGRGEADDWSDLDINVIAADDESSELLASAHEAEAFGALAVWVDCSFNAPPGGAMTFARYLVDDHLILVDWHAWPRSRARLTAGAKVLWARPGVELEPFDGTVVDLTGSQVLRSIPLYSRQQRAEWELCMLQIAASRPARRQDAREIAALIGITIDSGLDSLTQLDALEAHLRVLAPMVAPRAFEATRRRFDLVRQTLEL